MRCCCRSVASVERVESGVTRCREWVAGAGGATHGKERMRCAGSTLLPIVFARDNSLAMRAPCACRLLIMYRVRIVALVFPTWRKGLSRPRSCPRGNCDGNQRRVSSVGLPVACPRKEASRAVLAEWKEGVQQGFNAKVAGTCAIFVRRAFLFLSTAEYVSRNCPPRDSHPISFRVPYLTVPGLPYLTLLARRASSGQPSLHLEVLSSFSAYFIARLRQLCPSTNNASGVETCRFALAACYFPPYLSAGSIHRRVVLLCSVSDPRGTPF